MFSYIKNFYYIKLILVLLYLANTIKKINKQLIKKFYFMPLNKRKLLKILLNVENKTQKMKIFKYGLKYLVAVSGGQDSMCLAIFLRSFQRKFNFKFDIVYCHHAWQQDSFFNVLQFTKYAVYTKTGYFIFLNSNH